MSVISKHRIVIDAPPARVWEALTTPELMKRWMGEPEMPLDIRTSWVVGSPIVVTGRHHVQFVNTGTVLHFEPNRLLRYSHLSSLSRLSDASENHSTLEFQLATTGDGTELTLTVTGFPTESIFRHLDFYWRSTLHVLKRFVESSVCVDTE